MKLAELDGAEIRQIHANSPTILARVGVRVPTPIDLRSRIVPFPSAL